MKSPERGLKDVLYINLLFDLQHKLPGALQTCAKGVTQIEEPVMPKTFQ